MVNQHNYVIVHVKSYGVEDDDPPFVLSFAMGDVYASRDMRADQLRRLRNDITEVLEDHALDRRFIEWGDLYAGTGIDDPENDIPF